MTTLQIKSEIQKVLNEIPEDTLQDILEYLKTIQHDTSDASKLTANFRKILLEDNELLKKLAE